MVQVISKLSDVGDVYLDSEYDAWLGEGVIMKDSTSGCMSACGFYMWGLPTKSHQHWPETGSEEASYRVFDGLPADPK